MNPAGSTTFIVDTGRFLWVVFLSCLIIEVVLVYLDLTVNWQQWSGSSAIRRLFNTTREDSLASFFMVGQTVLAALVAWTIYAVNVVRKAERKKRIGWLLVASFMIYMAIDDGSMVHERIGSAVDEAVGVGAFPSYAWQLVVAPAFAAMGMFMLYFLWKELPRPQERWLVVAAIGCFSLAVAMDFVEGLPDGYRWLIDNWGWRKSTTTHFSKSFEEFIEMLGMSILLVVFLGHLARSTGELVVRFTDAGAESSHSSE